MKTSLIFTIKNKEKDMERRIKGRKVGGKGVDSEAKRKKRV